MALNGVFADASRPRKIAAGVIGLVVVAAIGHVALSPQSAERDTLRRKHESLLIEIAKARADDAALRPLRAQVENLRRRLEVAKSRLPSAREVPGLYRQLSELALHAGLALALFAPKPVEDKGTVVEIPIAVTAEGSYHQLGHFFSQVGRIPRIVNLGDFRLAGVERATGAMRADLTLATYLFRPEGASPRPAAAPPATHAADAALGARRPGVAR